MAGHFLLFLILFYGLVFIIWIGAVVRLVGAIFSIRLRKLIAARPVLHCLWFFAALLVTAAVFLAPRLLLRPHTSRVRALVTMSALRMACKAYQVEYNSLPSSDNAAIIKSLHGANPRKIVFLELPKRDINSAGEAIDPWGTPYRFVLQDRQTPSIRSAGPKHIFNDEDDLVFEPEAVFEPSSH